MSSGKIFVVIGAKGGTGAEIVKRLSEKKADEVSEIRCVVRSPSSIPAGLLPTGDKRVKVYAGDATNYASLVKTFSAAEAVFFAAQGKGYKGICKVDRDSMKILGKAALEKVSFGFRFTSRRVTEFLYSGGKESCSHIYHVCRSKEQIQSNSLVA